MTDAAWARLRADLLAAARDGDRERWIRDQAGRRGLVVTENGLRYATGPDASAVEIRTTTPFGIVTALAAVDHLEAPGRPPQPGTGPPEMTVEVLVDRRGLLAEAGPCAVWPADRRRLDFGGADGMLTFAFTVLAADKEARLAGADASISRVTSAPGLVSGWLEAHAPDQAALERLVTAIVRRATERAGRDGTGVSAGAQPVPSRVLLVRPSDEDGAAAAVVLAGLLAGPTGGARGR